MLCVVTRARTVDTEEIAVLRLDERIHAMKFQVAAYEELLHAHAGLQMLRRSIQHASNKQARCSNELG